LGVAMTRRWPDRDPLALANAVRTHVPLVQVPPRGLWGRSGAARHTPATQWLGEPLADAPSAERLVLRYLAAFGPATVADAQVWSGLTRLGEIMDRLRPQLRVCHDERGAELFDVPEARQPNPDMLAPARLIAPFDNLVLGHANRTRIISDETRKRLFTVNGVFPGFLLVDGFVAGTWRLDRRKDGTTLHLVPDRALRTSERDELTEEGAKLLTFATPDGTKRDIQFDQQP
jgi:Winged helix DNA-binding domain